MSKDLAPSLIRELLHYDRETGKFFWKQRPVEMFAETSGRTAEHACANWNARYAGAEALTARTEDGYFRGQVMGKPVKAHRVAWCIETGDWPEATIDHIDANPSNNRWANLRAATQGQNNCNRMGAVVSSSRYKGVSWYERKKKWEAYIQIDGRKKSLGHFWEEAEAARVHDEWARIYHGEFARLNFPDLLIPETRPQPIQEGFDL